MDKTKLKKYVVISGGIVAAIVAAVVTIIEQLEGAGL
jgi:hypothetical protein